MSVSSCPRKPPLGPSVPAGVRSCDSPGAHTLVHAPGWALPGKFSKESLRTGRPPWARSGHCLPCDLGIASPAPLYFPMKWDVSKSVLGTRIGHEPGVPLPGPATLTAGTQMPPSLSRAEGPSLHTPVPNNALARLPFPTCAEAAGRAGQGTFSHGHRCVPVGEAYSFTAPRFPQT